MVALAIESVTKQYGSNTVINNLSMTVEQGEFVALLGPSGCGKTTLLRMIAGFVEQTTGKIIINNKDVSNIPSFRRNTGMVFQNYALFPHMTVKQNIEFGLKMKGVGESERAEKLDEVLALVELQNLSHRYPRELSGGQQQRVAVARALIIQPDIFLLDEPLSNLDAKLRQSVGQELRSLQQKLGLTTVFVTHDQNEALALADKLVLMNQGTIVQSGSGSELYNSPLNTFVATFLGQTNLIHGSITEGGKFVSEHGVEVDCDTNSLDKGLDTILCIRPESIVLGPNAKNKDVLKRGEIVNITYLGSITEIALYVHDLQKNMIIHVNSESLRNENIVLEKGQDCSIGWQTNSSILLRDIP